MSAVTVIAVGVGLVALVLLLWALGVVPAR